MYPNKPLEPQPTVNSAIATSTIFITKWPVEIQLLTSFEQSFNNALNAGFPPAQAIWQAQRKLLCSRKWAHPKYWAAFELV